MVSRERIVTPYHGQPSRDSNRKRNGLAARSVKDYSQEGRGVARRLADSQPRSVQVAMVAMVASS
jgi:hypothetical protein